MVKITIAGGSGQVAQEILDALLATNKHDITILSRSHSSTPLPFDVQWRTVDYNDQASLVATLHGTHTLLSFLQLLNDPESKTQKALIDAATIAGVKRFAPSEYGSKEIENMVWWAGKEKCREYLEKVNRDGKVLEYTLFQPGLFLDYLAFPYKTAKHVEPLQSVFDFQNCRAIMVEGYEEVFMSLTSVADVAAVVARAVEYEGEWPTVSGIQGNRVKVSDIVALGEQIRGRSFAVSKVKAEDLEAGDLESWGLEKKHKAVSNEQDGSFVKAVTIGMLLSTIKGAWDTSDEANRMFPDYQFAEIEDFLGRAWENKP